ncbi:MAG: glycine cleavage system protein GcvH [Clostridiales bacterium]|nr:glycine cleavage system protein GcvH [Clostridiales bacterium]
MVKEGLLYAKSHEWIEVDGKEGKVGISDYAQHLLGDIVFVELPEEDAEIDKEDSFGVVESVKAASDVYMPVTGKIIEINEELEDEPELLNKDAYKNFIMKIEILDESQLDDLLTKEQYEAYIETIEHE